MSVDIDIMSMSITKNFSVAKQPKLLRSPR